MVDLSLPNSQEVKFRVFLADHRTSENSKPRGSSSCLCWSSRICRWAFHQKDRNSPCLFYGYLEFLKEHVMNSGLGGIDNHQNIKCGAECGEHFLPRLNAASRNLRSIIFIYTCFLESWRYWNKRITYFVRYFILYRSKR